MRFINIRRLFCSDEFLMLLLGEVAFTFFLVIATYFRQTNYFLSRDSITYISQIENYIQDNNFIRLQSDYPDAYLPFLYIWIISLLTNFGLNIVKAGLLINFLACCVFSLYFIRFIHFFVKSFFFSFTITVLTLIHPNIINNSIQIQRDSLFLCLYFLCFYYILKFFSKNSLFDLLLSSVFCSLAVFTRLEGVDFFLFLFICLILNKSFKAMTLFVYVFSFLFTLIILVVLLDIHFNSLVIYFNRYIFYLLKFLK